jgi:BirA family biotin operon repressor/biotin-[acetyl-CoA-carboxylase] ligase
LNTHIPPLNEALIRSELTANHNALIEDILIFSSIPSTNDSLWQRFEQNQKTPAVCLAETQTAGRGRRGDKWHSPACGNLYLSLFWPHCADSLKQGLSIAVGMTLINTIKEFKINNLSLKWPNDVLCHKQKLAGILVESRFNTRQYTVVGIGLNFKLPEATKTLIQQPSTSLEQLCDPVPCRNWLAGKILQNMIETIELFEHRGLTDFVPLWPQYDALHEQAITLIDGAQKSTAIACGINDQGELRYLQNNEIKLLSNSHVSIRFAS